MKKKIILFVTLLFSVSLHAGMPRMDISYLASLRLETVSFFIVVFLLSSLIVKYLWNSALVDLFGVPKITYKRTLALMILWGMFFNLVLTMISGARELMTPKAWIPKEMTYALKTDEYSKEHMVALRRKHLQELQVALWDYAYKNNGSFPPHCYSEAIPEELWKTLHESGVRYHYIEGTMRGEQNSILLFEPAVLGDERLVLFSNGDIVLFSTEELKTIIYQNYFEERK